MLEQVREEISGGADGDYVEFSVAGPAAAGAYHCADCGYGVTVQAVLPRCPMCRGTNWERAWSPLTRGQPVH